MCSVLNNQHNIKFVDIPYPYLIIDNALPTTYYEKLNQAFPAYDKIIKSDVINGGKYKDNFGYRYNASDSLNDNLGFKNKVVNEPAVGSRYISRVSY